MSNMNKYCIHLLSIILTIKSALALELDASLKFLFSLQKLIYMYISFIQRNKIKSISIQIQLEMM